MAKKDDFEDFEVVFFVKNVENFTEEHRWTKVFGEKLIEPLPETMFVMNEYKEKKISFNYLMLFKV